MALSWAETIACGGGARAVRRLRALGGEEEVRGVVSVSSPLGAMSVTPEPRARNGVGRDGPGAQLVDGGMRSSVQAETRATPSGSSGGCHAEAYDAPKRRSVKPTPRVRRGGLNSNQSVGVFDGIMSSRANAEFKENTSDGTWKARHYDDGAGPSNEKTVIGKGNSVDLQNVAMRESFDPWRKAVDEEQSGDKANAVAVSHDDAFLRTSKCGHHSSREEQTIATTEGTTHYLTMLNLPDVDDISGITSDEELDDLNDPELL